MRILLVEDDAMIGKTLQQALQQDGYAVDWVSDGRAAQAAIAAADDAYAMVLLDLGLPKKDGIELLRDLRRQGNRIRVLVVTARDAVADRVAGLDAGADDYLTKPFALAELEARIRALIRRSHGHDQNVLVNGPLAFDTAARTATVAGCNVELSSRELAVLELLLMRCGRVIAKEQFVEHLCGWDQDVTDNAIEVYVHRLRRKLEPAGVHVQTVRGLGYCLAKA